MTTIFDNLNGCSKAADLIRNTTVNIEYLCREMEKNRKAKPTKQLRQIIHRCRGLEQGLLAILEAYNKEVKL